MPFLARMGLLLALLTALPSHANAPEPLQCGPEVGNCPSGNCPLESLLFDDFVTDDTRIVDPATLGAYKVPPVSERPFDPDAGDKVKITRFAVEGVTPNPEAGITVEGLEATAEAALVRLSGASGARALTVGQMVKVADEVTTVYRSNGYIVAKAFIPVQEIKDDGVVRIQVLEGRVAAIVVENNKHFDETVIARPAQPLVGAIPTRDAVETALLYAQDHPGIRLFGTFRPAKQAGETDLVLQVLDEDRFGFLLGADNHGIKLTGEFRARADMIWNNPLGFGDRFNISLLQSIDPANTTYGSAGYRVPLGPRGVGLLLNASQNAFRINDGAFAALDLQGEISTYDGGFDWQFVRSRFLNVKTDISYARKESELKGTGNLVVSDDTLDVAALRLSFDRVDTRFKGVDIGSVRVRNGLGGEFIGGNAPFLDQQFLVGDLAYTRVQPVAETQTVVLRARAQFADQALSSIEQFSMAGPDGVRAYPVGEVVRDSGRFASLEYRVQAPGFSQAAGPFGRRWGDLLQFWLTADYAYGENEKNITGTTNGIRSELSGYGASIQFAVPGSFQFLIHGAKPLSPVLASDGDNFRMYGELSYRF